MITAWQVYWVMQLDSIGTTAGVIAIAGTIFGGIATGIGCMARSEGEEFADGLLKVARPVFALGVLCIALSAFLPSTKTAAAMVVLPAIVNNEALQHEAGDLYRLAKKALSDAVGDEPAPKPEPQA